MEYQFQGKQKYIGSRSIINPLYILRLFFNVILIGQRYIIIILINSTILFVPEQAITVVKIQSRRNK